MTLTPKLIARAPVRALLLSSCLALAGCGEGLLVPPEEEDEPTPDPGAATADVLYAPDHVVEIEITMDPADASALANETNDIFTLLHGEDCMDSPWAGPFNWYRADIRVDGVLVEQVGVRKKGLIGSLSTTKPSIKVKFDKFVEGQSYGGLERMTLNNSVSDPSLVRQCLGYQLFTDAGMPAPRCNFAHVTAQGADLGVYVNIEPLKKRFLRRAFDGDDDGDLYEGTLSDFRPGWTDTFEAETSETDASLAPILAVTDALTEADDAVALEALDDSLDMAAFRRFWAMEALIAHVDGYNGNRNNYYVYRPSGSDGLLFLPWGIDAILRGGGDAPLTLANSALPRRLWANADEQAAYIAALEELLEDVWDEDALLAEIDRMVALIDPYALDDPWREAETESTRGFVSSRRERLEAALDEPLPGLGNPPGDSPCLVDAGELRVEFETTWDSLGSQDPLNVGWTTITGTYHGDEIDLEGGAMAGIDNGRVVVASLALTGPASVWEVVAFVPGWMIDGSPIPLGGFGAQAYLVDVDWSTGDQVTVVLGSMWNAWLEFTALEAEPGGVVSGVIEGPLYDGGP